MVGKLLKIKCLLEEDKKCNNNCVGVYTVAQLRMFFLLYILEDPLLEDHMTVVCQKAVLENLITHPLQQQNKQSC